VVSSTFTDYDDACLEITTIAPPRRLLSSNNTGWDVRTTSMVSPSGGNSASLKVGLCLEANSASPELGLGQLPPLESRIRSLLQLFPA
jgi:hypothetical protein